MRELRPHEVKWPILPVSVKTHPVPMVCFYPKHCFDFARFLGHKMGCFTYKIHVEFEIIWKYDKNLLENAQLYEWQGFS